MILWISVALLAVTGLPLALSLLRGGKGGDAAGRGLERAFLAFAVLVWCVLAGTTALGFAFGSRWLLGAPLLLVIVPAAIAAKKGLGRLFFRLRSSMPTATLRRLERAAHDGHSARVEELIAAGADVKQTDVGRALLRAALTGRYARDVVEVLLEAGADPRDPELLALAMESRSTDVGPFVKHGANPDTVLPGGDSLAFAALKQGRLEVVEAVLRAGGNPNLKDREGRTLIWAHASGAIGFGPGNWSFVRKLLDLGADPEIPGPDGSRVRDCFAKTPYGIHPDHLEALRARLGG